MLADRRLETELTAKADGLDSADVTFQTHYLNTDLYSEDESLLVLTR